MIWKRGQVPPEDARFWARVRLPESPTDCWEWAGFVKNSGYGSFSPSRGKTYLAHRYSFTIVKGAIPHGMHVLHSCDNKTCVNPAHLSLGTARDNMLDMRRKGRAKWGEYQRIKTHCKRGHEFAGENLSIDTKGRRTCLACRRLSSRRDYWTKRGAA